MVVTSVSYTKLNTINIGTFLKKTEDYEWGEGVVLYSGKYSISTKINPQAANVIYIWSTYS